MEQYNSGNKRLDPNNDTSNIFWNFNQNPTKEKPKGTTWLIVKTGNGDLSLKKSQTCRYITYYQSNCPTLACYSTSNFSQRIKAPN